MNSFKIRYAFKCKPKRKQFNCSTLPCPVRHPCRTALLAPVTLSCTVFCASQRVLWASFRKEGATERSRWTDNGDIFRSLLPRSSFPREKTVCTSPRSPRSVRKSRDQIRTSKHAWEIKRKGGAEVWPTDPDCNINASASVLVHIQRPSSKCRTKKSRGRIRNCAMKKRLSIRVKSYLLDMLWLLLYDWTRIFVSNLGKGNNVSLSPTLCSITEREHPIASWILGQKRLDV